MKESESKLQVLLNATDTDGRKLSYNANDGGKLYLTDGNDNRFLGHILCGETNILYTKYEREEQIFRKTNAWSVNRLIVSHVDTIHYYTDTHDYQITKGVALEFGVHLHFNDSTELKLYIPIKYWEVRPRGLAESNPLELRRRNAIGDTWFSFLKETLMSDMMSQLGAWVSGRRRVSTVYPDSEDVFKAFKLCSFYHTKVVILGQDPYIDGSASGLAFGYKENCKKAIQKSLDVIYEEMEEDMYNGFLLNHDYTLEHWAKQGVLLLNTILTVEKGKTNSHKGMGWERFTKIALYELIVKSEQPVVFMVWGREAEAHLQEVMTVVGKKGIRFIHKILYSPHPAADLYKKNNIGIIVPDYPKTFRGNRHFSQANEFLKLHKRKPIQW